MRKIVRDISDGKFGSWKVGYANLRCFASGSTLYCLYIREVRIARIEYLVCALLVRISMDSNAGKSLSRNHEHQTE